MRELARRVAVGRKTLARRATFRTPDMRDYLAFWIVALLCVQVAQSCKSPARRAFVGTFAAFFAVCGFVKAMDYLTAL